MVLPWIAQLAIAIVINVISYVLTPKPATQKPDSVQQLENPTIETGRARPVVFGTIWIKEVQVEWFGDKSVNSYEVKA